MKTIPIWFNPMGADETQHEVAERVTINYPLRKKLQHDAHVRTKEAHELTLAVEAAYAKRVSNWGRREL